MKIYIFLVTLLLSCCVSAQRGKYQYGEALQKAIFFYEEQRSGFINTSYATNRVSWRGNSGLNDGKDNGVDLAGGWLDAGDNVKFGFPMAGTVTILAWGLLEFPQGYAASKQDVHLKKSLRWACDYFIQAHVAPYELYGQVGIGLLDHEWWGAAELLDIVFNTTTRKSFKISANCPGSDLAGETAAALAATSIVFANEDPAYSKLLSTHAQQLYDFAERYQGLYSNCITDAQSFYRSSTFYDELVWGGAWVAKATGNTTYLDRALKYYPQIAGQYSGTLDWGSKEYGAYVLLSQMLNQSSQFFNDAQNFLDWWTIGYNGKTVQHTTGGLAFLYNWGALRYPASTSMLMQIFSKQQKDPKRLAAYQDFSIAQINYILGSNPLNRSFVGGFGVNPPVNEHHRTGHSSYANDWYLPATNRHILYGALVGGPDTLDDFSYHDFRSVSGWTGCPGPWTGLDYQQNECACDYVAGFCGALAGMYEKYGGEPDPNFPQKETVGLEFLIEASIYARADAPTSLEILTVVENHSVKLGDVIITQTYNEGGKLLPLTQWGTSGSVYYFEVSYKGVSIYPGGLAQAHKQSRVLITTKQGASWDHSTDWSFSGLQEGWPKPANNIPLYQNEVRIWGSEPPKN